MNRREFRGVSIFDTEMMGLERFCGIYLIRGRRNVMIDAGTSECAVRLIAHLKRTGFNPDYVVVTHNHYDHIGALASLKKEYKSLKIISGSCGYDRLKDPNEINRLFTDEVFEPFDDIIVLDDGEVLDAGDRKLRIIYTPGHSNDSISVYDIGENIIFPGDLPGDRLWGSTYLSPHISPDFSEKKYLESLEKVMSLDLECSALTHYGFFTGDDAKGIFLDQMLRYSVWKSELIPAWESARNPGDLVPVLKKLLKGSFFEDLPGYDSIINAFAGWCIMGYRASGLIS